MSYSRAYPTTFTPVGSTAQSLHNGTYVFATEIMREGIQAKPILHELPDGTLYDPREDDNAPEIPGVFSHQITVIGSTGANAEALLNKWYDYAKVQKKGTLAATTLAGTAISCTARLIGFKDVSDHKLEAHTQLKAKLTWQGLTTWQ